MFNLFKYYNFFILYALEIFFCFFIFEAVSAAILIVNFHFTDYLFYPLWVNLFLINFKIN